jgi:energy-coupling factor transporter ATP-binding protein EcfA2
LVNKAVNLGIAIYNMRQGESIRYETLFRDETVGALDAVNGKESVRMLRRAMDLGGFYQVMFICHTPLVMELADSIHSIRDGCVFIPKSAAVARWASRHTGPLYYSEISSTWLESIDSNKL